MSLGFEKRRNRTRTKVAARNKSQKVRLAVHRSNKNIAAQIINLDGSIVKSFSSLNIKDEKLKKDKSGIEIAAIVGENIAKLAVKAKVTEVVFDKSGYLYSGRVKSLADAARKNGLKF